MPESGNYDVGCGRARPLTNARHANGGGHALRAHPPAYERANTRVRLLAGISAMSTSAKPTDSANRSTSPTSRTPHSGLALLRLESNTALLSAVCLPWRLNGP